MASRLLLGLVALGAFSVACVNDSNTNAPPPGALGGPCFSNGTCNAGLACVVVGSQAQCEVSDATVDAPTVDAPNDGPAVNDAPQDQSSDVQSSDAGCPTTPSLPCNAHCSGSDYCCTSNGTCGPSANCTGNAWQCQTSADCPTTAPICCIGSSAYNLSTCPPTYQWANGSYCTTTCNSMKLCLQNSECSGGTPHCDVVALKPATSSDPGFCLP